MEVNDVGDTYVSVGEGNVVEKLDGSSVSVMLVDGNIMVTRPIPITEANKWEATIALWQKIASLNTHQIRGMIQRPSKPINEAKNIMLAELGYERCKFGCPLCQLYWDDRCARCPIANIHGYEYACESIDHPYCQFRSRESRESAIEFSTYLSEMRERDEMGLIPKTRNLKPHREE
jgi:hypothetical protein